MKETTRRGRVGFGIDHLLPIFPPLRCQNIVRQVTQLEVERESVEWVFGKHTPEVYEISYFWQVNHGARGQNTRGQRPDEG